MPNPNGMSEQTSPIRQVDIITKMCSRSLSWGQHATHRIQVHPDRSSLPKSMQAECMRKSWNALLLLKAYVFRRGLPLKKQSVLAAKYANRHNVRPPMRLHKYRLRPTALPPFTATPDHPSSGDWRPHPIQRCPSPRNHARPLLALCKTRSGSRSSPSPAKFEIEWWCWCWCF